MAELGGSRGVGWLIARPQEAQVGGRTPRDRPDCDLIAAMIVRCGLDASPAGLEQLSVGDLLEEAW